MLCKNSKKNGIPYLMLYEKIEFNEKWDKFTKTDLIELNSRQLQSVTRDLIHDLKCEADDEVTRIGLTASKGKGL